MRFNTSLPDDRVNISHRSAAREAALLVAGLCAIAALAAGSLALLSEYLIVHMPPEVESRFFGNTWAELAESFEAEESEALQELMDRLQSHWSDRLQEVRVAVFEDEQPNAFALPGGLVLVTSGLLESIDNENELAFILGHELGHLRNRDHLRGMGRGLSWAFVAAALGLGGGTAGTFASAASSLTQRSFDREQEHHADFYGLWILGREYGHAEGALDVFSEVLAEPGDLEDSSSSEVGQYFLSHPANPDRIAALRVAAEHQGLELTGAESTWQASGGPTAEAPQGL